MGMGNKDGKLGVQNSLANVRDFAFYLTFSFTSSKMECNPLQLGVMQMLRQTSN